MNDKTTIIKGRVERILEVKGTAFSTRTIYDNEDDAESVYVRTRLYYKDRGWRMKPTTLPKEA